MSWSSLRCQSIKYNRADEIFERYLKCIDRFYNNYVSCFMTGGSMLPSL